VLLSPAQVVVVLALTGYLDPGPSYLALAAKSQPSAQPAGVNAKGSSKGNRKGSVKGVHNIQTPPGKRIKSQHAKKARGHTANTSANQGSSRTSTNAEGSSVPGDVSGEGRLHPFLLRLLVADDEGEAAAAGSGASARAGPVVASSILPSTPNTFLTCAEDLR
jgi:hypothetical protein